MQPLWRQFLLLWVAFAFILGGVVAAAMPIAIAAEPCAPDQGHAGHHHDDKKKSDHNKSRHQSQSACIQCCCVGICASIPNPTGALTSESVAMTRVVYWDGTRFSGGRSIKPEHGPPRPLA
jgi:hypothetical protein